VCVCVRAGGGVHGYGCVMCHDALLAPAYVMCHDALLVNGCVMCHDALLAPALNSPALLFFVIGLRRR
jgi:hypothetical protein